MHPAHPLIQSPSLILRPSGNSVAIADRSETALGTRDSDGFLRDSAGQVQLAAPLRLRPLVLVAALSYDVLLNAVVSASRR